MVTLVMTFTDPDGLADTLSRRFVADLRETPGIDSAWLVRRDAVEGERGIIEEIGTLGVRLLTGPAIEAVLSLAGTVLSRSSEREVRVRLPDGREFALKGSDLSDATFEKTTQALLDLMAGRQAGEKA